MSDDQRATKVTPYEGYVGENLGELSNDSSLAENSGKCYLNNFDIHVL